MEKNANLSDAEKEIMEAVWRAKKAVCVNDVFSLLGGSDRKYTTVATFMTRLEKKGFLKSKKLGNQNYYEAAVSESEYKKCLTDEFVREVYGDSASDLIASLCRDRISEKDYGELMEMLGRYEKDKAGE